MSKKHCLTIAGFVLVVIFLVACQQKSETPSPTATGQPTLPPATHEPLSPAAQEELNILNGWDVAALAIVECPKDYPGFVDSGETRSWVKIRESHLSRLGISVRWNCEIKAFEATPKGQPARPLCGCPPIQLE
jgi:hypothetical protein